MYVKHRSVFYTEYVFQVAPSIFQSVIGSVTLMTMQIFCLMEIIMYIYCTIFTYCIILYLKDEVYWSLP
jgi:uncharacterized membrane protein